MNRLLLSIFVVATLVVATLTVSAQVNPMAPVLALTLYSQKNPLLFSETINGELALTCLTFTPFRYYLNPHV